MAKARPKIKELGAPDSRSQEGGGVKPLAVTIISFGHKAGAPPVANMVFDVRFLKNPFWVPELRPLTGLDQAVREYVLSQETAGDFLDSLMQLLSQLLPKFEDLEIYEFSIALGCTGGQHRSAALVEELADRLQRAFPHFAIKRSHRELDKVRA